MKIIIFIPGHVISPVGINKFRIHIQITRARISAFHIAVRDVRQPTPGYRIRRIVPQDAVGCC